MLRQRILTAIVLLLIVVAAVMAPTPWPMLALLGLMTVCALWEWLRLVMDGAAVRWGGALLAALALALLSRWLVDGRPALETVFGSILLPLALLFWLAVAPLAVAHARVPDACRPALLAATGGLLLAATWYALAWIFLRHGAAALISLWALIWAADIAAYFTGRALGRHKLAPRVSPGKTLEGAAGGILAATVWLLATALWWPGSFGALLVMGIGWVGVLGVGVALAAWSIVGDLFESLLKRRAGVKDSSQLLPGHGGVYDRIDAVLPVAPAAALLLLTSL
ncbi:MAG: phosphatidate cytidylyltransferase [Castellaniella sp.]|uniref:phosphatidate cytidylyltransferase n=1 Tax=Castellaniella sp. TaxID=1955812 RepID=UPI002A368EA7|nr:phosphatidate cytidylyltransferase [Castellaniella sp.]MDY0308211.1 phosphatidate cytidylyltransferase [Castellaniella sp.]